MQIIDLPDSARISMAKPTAGRPLELPGQHYVVMDAAIYDDMIGRLLLAEAQPVG